MEIGPVDVLVVEFPGNKFSGAIVPALLDLVRAGTVRVLDLLFVYKEADGTVGSVDLTGLGLELDPAFRDLDGQLTGGLLDAEDVGVAAEGLEPNTSVALIIWENSWAAHFVSTLRDADAKVVDQARIPSDVVIAALDAAANDNS